MPSALPRAACAAGLAALIAVAACDTAPGVDTGPPSAPPVVRGLAVSPLTAVREDLARSGGRVTIPLVASADVSDPEGRLDSVQLVVENPATAQQPLVRVPMRPGADGRYAASASLTLPDTAFGSYRVLVVARDRDGRYGEGSATLAYTVRGRPVVARGGIVVQSRAAEGANVVFTLLVTADVTDPDGLADVVRVEAATLGTPVTTIPLLDDGRGADAGAADGRYSAALRVPVPAASLPGTLLLTLRAVDRSGLRSAPVTVDAILPR